VIEACFKLLYERFELRILVPSLDSNHLTPKYESCTFLWGGGGLCISINEFSRTFSSTLYFKSQIYCCRFTCLKENGKIQVMLHNFLGKVLVYDF
jgi:hypothetical protein